MNTISDFFYNNDKTGERKRRNLLVLKEREYATQKIMKSPAEDSVEGIDLNLLSDKEAARLLKAKAAYEKQLEKAMPKAYRKFLKSNIVAVETVLGKK